MEEIIEKPLTPQQRMKRGRIMKRLAKRIQRAKERKKKKLADKATLEKRANKKAKEIARQKIMGKDKSYKDLSYSQKVTIDKLVSKRFSSDRLKKMAKKIMPRVRKAEQERLLKYRAGQSDSQVEEIEVNYQTMFLESGGAGEWGTDKLKNKYSKETPGQNEGKIPHALDPKKSLKHAMTDVGLDKDADGDVDILDKMKDNPDEITGTEKNTKAIQSFQKKRGELEKKHTKKGVAYEEFMVEVKQDKDIKDKEGTQPAKYYAKDAEGDEMSKSTKSKRDAHFKKGAEKDDNDPSAYKPAPGDKGAETKPSKYTKKYKQMFGEGKEEDAAKERIKREKESDKRKHDAMLDRARTTDTRNKNIQTESSEKGLKAKAEKSGISLSILRKVYNRGVAAWRTGHRPGTTPEQWGYARVNSFITGGKTRTTADADLWKQHKG